MTRWSSQNEGLFQRATIILSTGWLNQKGGYHGTGKVDTRSGVGDVAA